jgi:hypothetical protein
MNSFPANSPETQAPFIHVIVPRKEVENCTTDPTLRALNTLMDDPHKFTRFQNNVMISFQGYDDDPRGLFEISEVREFIKELDTQWYSWLFFMTKEPCISPLAIITLCLCRYTRSSAGLFIPDRKDSRRFMWNHFGALNGLCQICNLSKEQKEAATQEVTEYFMKVGFVEGSDSPRLGVESAKTGTILPHTIDGMK